jgi:hypothetical protein
MPRPNPTRPPDPDDEIDGLRLHTLAGAYWAAHRVVQLLDIESINTVDQLLKRWTNTSRGPQGRAHMVLLLRALHDLAEHTNQLAVTTLIRAVDHPLVTRHLIPKE